MASKTPNPTGITLHKQRKVLEVAFSDGARFELPCEYLRVYSPSADVRGHSPDQAVLQIGKEDVNISEIQPVGHYAVQLNFDDGHNTGIYSWDELYDLGQNRDRYWTEYLKRLKSSGHKRKGEER